MMLMGAYASEARFSPSCFTGKERDNESGLDYFINRQVAQVLRMLINLQPVGVGAPHLAFEMWDDTFRAFLGSANEYDAEGRIWQVARSSICSCAPFIASFAMSGRTRNKKAESPGARIARPSIAGS